MSVLLSMFPHRFFIAWDIFKPKGEACNFLLRDGSLMFQLFEISHVFKDEVSDNINVIFLGTRRKNPN